MINNINNSNTFNSSPSQVELDFLATLLEPADATYPWNPADQESEAYFNELEQQFLGDDLWQEDELNKRSQDFYSQLDNLWSTHHVDSASKSHNLKQILMASLQEAFVVVPQGWLNTIAQNAAEMFSSQQPIGEQLVRCVQDMLPSWGADDLLVLARPYAYAMRSGEPQCPKAMITKLGNREWTSLSEVEQAKVSLAISYYALNELNSFQSES
ncbi:MULTISPECIES: hypothetical protein [unclassified Tolypothrix]|uniref:hypothetical protein n=1 Tax=unclassified Tolypothrix TaxID=2649714 RepID=UPI0005EABA6A|nr:MULTISPECIES: hypothetical protein [unclassified Tolypothrix]BAY93483.1 hypothetical protein NIES3275_55220 [Microchaete diplosiphon NIES-3275]EKE99456.1 hypothetical protein FDUTEX481_10032 [Tolypothrix sp. PCC 7601]MBE9080812.1 hypothetical protein [Tolypothrix sp. LEGE 11397]UYD27323.1 hypothetical protein HGR01_04275 [Tolypothrix sp. PCC 7712]UYD36816.1 hypothetical protein HG267_14455 [Tolypothrix sp. PCC 7601]